MEWSTSSLAFLGLVRHRHQIRFWQDLRLFYPTNKQFSPSLKGTTKPSQLLALQLDKLFSTKEQIYRFALLTNIISTINTLIITAINNNADSINLVWEGDCDLLATLIETELIVSESNLQSLCVVLE
jgi:hypothetical protein